MKKHPVDDLFKRKLTEWYKTPSENAWLKIQEGTETRRRPAVWIWYAAASVAVSLIAGYLIWGNGQDGTIKQTDSQKTVATVKQQKGKEQVESIVKGRDFQAQVLLKQKDIVAQRKAPVARHEKNLTQHQPAFEKKQSKTRAETPVIAIQEPSVVENSVASADSPKSSDIETVKPPVDKLTMLAVVNKEKAEQAIKIVVAVEASNDEFEERPKSSRFSRVFRQLKNARAGERVNWEEVGFNPKNLVARVDDRLRNKEERTSERNQNPIERTKL
ncbi:hypothetical protein [Dyadobacter arcticus]|uniref:Uncharacterized protein n=1 Tax=Dyadobacter arcticus TaxID=1078754 RepID=A0ABX0UHI8_9BACT|nr:hypothetical protein [Dyadobacter arcticus]NIJ51030.1 hypothetical protein [Dyadobacter arcticus]